jgi:ribosomal protein L16 Arg81 hydroxylase
VVRAFDEILWPVDQRNFCEQYWDRRSLYIGGTPDKFAHLFDVTRFQTVTKTRCPFKAGFSNTLGEFEERSIATQEISSVLEIGATVCALRIDGYDDRLRDLCSSICGELGLIGDLHVNCYLSLDKRGFPLHFDMTPVWILQIEGEKHWSFGAHAAIVAPLRGFVWPTGHISGVTCADGPLPPLDWSCFQEARVRPGDLLYLPAGTLHMGRAVGRSMALTLSYYLPLA